MIDILTAIPAMLHLHRPPILVSGCDIYTGFAHPSRIGVISVLARADCTSVMA